MADIQAYIEDENKRLERDPTRSFDPREINIRMEYKYCPNMIVIDTPGMIHPPKGRQLTAQQRALQQASREAEALVLAKIKCPDYIILCVEDTTDWKHATTRNIVMQADPHLSRTVLVTTKLDTKLPQFSESQDVVDFLTAPLIKALFSQLLGGPFFTTVPSGRVGTSRDFDNNEAFVDSLKRAERSDRNYLLNKLGKESKDALQRVGVSRLRAFLEARVEDSYRRNVAKIVPLLQTELHLSQSKLAAIESELEALSIERLRSNANEYREKFARELTHVIQGTIRVSPEEHGETLEGEIVKSGSFLSPDTVRSEAYQHLLAVEVGNHLHKLFGGAQYHRAVKEFTIAVRHAASPQVSENEIANAAGMADTHNGVNFMRAACVIAMEKAQLSFDPMLEALRQRTSHIMKRLYPIIERLVHSKGNAFYTPSGSATGSGSGIKDSAPPPPLSPAFQDLLQRIYHKFVEESLANTVNKCKDDLYGMTKFVTWDVEDKSGASTLYRLLPTPKKMAEIYHLVEEKKRQVHQGTQVEDKVLLAWQEANGGKQQQALVAKKLKTRGKQHAHALQVSPVSGEAMEDEAELSDYHRVMQLTEEMLSGSSASRTSSLVTSLVQYIIK